MKNTYKSNSDGTITIFAKGTGQSHKILIDEKDFQLVDFATKGSYYVKVAKGTSYALFCIRKKGQKDVYVRMHRLIMGLTVCVNDQILENHDLSLVVDHHPHHFGLDNRRCNLSIVTFNDNLRNKYYKKKPSNF